MVYGLYRKRSSIGMQSTTNTLKMIAEKLTKLILFLGMLGLLWLILSLWQETNTQY